MVGSSNPLVRLLTQTIDCVRAPIRLAQDAHFRIFNLAVYRILGKQ